MWYAPYFPDAPASPRDIAHVGLGAEERVARELGLDSAPARLLEPCPCVRTVACVRQPRRARGRYPEGDDWGYYCVVSDALEAMAHRGLEATGPVVTRLLAADVADERDGTRDYYLCWIPVRRSQPE